MNLPIKKLVHPIENIIEFEFEKGKPVVQII